MQRISSERTMPEHKRNRGNEIKKRVKTSWIEVQCSHQRSTDDITRRTCTHTYTHRMNVKYDTEMKFKTSALQEWEKILLRWHALCIFTCINWLAVAWLRFFSCVIHSQKPPHFNDEKSYFFCYRQVKCTNFKRLVVIRITQHTFHRQKAHENANNCFEFNGFFFFSNFLCAFYFQHQFESWFVDVVLFQGWKI